MTGGRRGRMDVLRGLALLVIAWDHAMMMTGQSSIFLLITPLFTSFSDGAEVFVFLAGAAFALVYGPVVWEQGVGAGLRRALRRAAELYVAQIFTFFVLIAALILLGEADGVIPRPVASFFQDPFRAIPAVITLSYLPTAFDVLPLYMLLLPYGVLLLALHRFSPRAPLLLGIGLYGLARLAPELSPPRYLPLFGSDGRWFFNPLAWQILFCAGLALALRPPSPSARLRRGLDIGALVVVLGAPILKLSTVILLYHPDLSTLSWGEQSLALRPGVVAGTDKTLLHPARLLVFGAMAWLVAAHLPEGHRLWRSAPGRALALLGRSSLPVFCLSTALVYGVAALWTPEGGTGLLLAMMAGNALLCLGLAAALDGTRRAPRSASALVK